VNIWPILTLTLILTVSHNIGAIKPFQRRVLNVGCIVCVIFFTTNEDLKLNLGSRTFVTYFCDVFYYHVRVRNFCMKEEGSQLVYNFLGLRLGLNFGLGLGLGFD
jgi:hypothetical protein